MMVNAMIDMSEAKDKVKKLEFIRDWITPALKGERIYTGGQMEEVCFELEGFAEQLHDPRFGMKSLGIFHPTTLVKPKESEMLTFDKRIEILCIRFRKQKSRVDSVMQGDMRKTLVVTVDAWLRESKIINDRRPKKTGEATGEAKAAAENHNDQAKQQEMTEQHKPLLAGQLGALQQPTINAQEQVTWLDDMGHGYQLASEEYGQDRAGHGRFDLDMFHTAPAGNNRHIAPPGSQQQMMDDQTHSSWDFPRFHLNAPPGFASAKCSRDRCIE
jgi:hypothetical protein